MLLVEMDGLAAQVQEESARVDQSCRDAGASEVRRAESDAERQALWQVRREISFALKTLAPIKFNHDIVVPTSRIPDLYALIARLRRQSGLRIPAFGHAGDGNIHVNVMVPAHDEDALRRARETEAALFRGVVDLEGAITGEHGVGFSKAPYLELGLTADTIALMRRIKAAFDPRGILNPGKIFPDEVARNPPLEP
jgi:glycolate oxidase